MLDIATLPAVARNDSKTQWYCGWQTSSRVLSFEGSAPSCANIGGVACTNLFGHEYQHAQAQLERATHRHSAGQAGRPLDLHGLFGPWFFSFHPDCDFIGIFLQREIEIMSILVSPDLLEAFVFFHFS